MITLNEEEEAALVEYITAFEFHEQAQQQRCEKNEELRVAKELETSAFSSAEKTKTLMEQCFKNKLEQFPAVLKIGDGYFMITAKGTSEMDVRRVKNLNF